MLRLKGGTDLYRVDAWHDYDLVQFKHIDMFLASLKANENMANHFVKNKED